MSPAWVCTDERDSRTTGQQDSSDDLGHSRGGRFVRCFLIMGFVCKIKRREKNLSSRPSSFAEGHAGPQIDRYCEGTDLELS